MDRASDYRSVALVARFSHMISYLKGILIAKTSDTGTVLINDAIGYDVRMNPVELSGLIMQTPLALHCYHHITDRSQELYGFLSPQTKEIFILLIENVAGIGPRSALKIIAKINSETLNKALATGNANALSEIGIGQKTAEKIIAGLKGKVNTVASASDSVKIVPPVMRETLDALVSLGYSKSESEHALQQIEAGTKKTEILIKEALHLL